MDCTNKSAGKWAFKKFDTIFGESQMIHWKGKSKDAKKMRSQKSKAIKKLIIVAYLRSIVAYYSRSLIEL